MRLIDADAVKEALRNRISENIDECINNVPTVDVLDKIRAEIDGLYEGMTNYYENRPWMLKDKVLEVIDKYRKMEKR